MYYFLSNRRKFSIIAILIITLIVTMVTSYNILKRENPKHTSYSCGTLLASFSDKALLNDKKVAVSSATSMEESLSPFSFMFSNLASFGKVTSLVDESNTILELAKLKKLDQETKSLSIPKNACYVSLNTPEFYQLNRLNSLPQTNIEVYNWVKNYSDYFPRKFQTTNAVIIMNDSAIHIQFNSSQSSSMNLLSIFSEIKAKITVYAIDKVMPNGTL